MLAHKLRNPLAQAESRSDAHVLNAREDMFERLFLLSQSLLCAEPGAPIRDCLLKPMRELFSVQVIVILDGETGRQYSLGTSRRGLAKVTRGACTRNCFENLEVSELLVFALSSNSGSRGAIGFEELMEPAGTGEALADVAAGFLRRRGHADKVSAHREVQRCARMDELAHRLKTPLTTIMAAAGGLRETGPLRSTQRELADLIESEALRLSEMSSSLVRGGLSGRRREAT